MRILSRVLCFAALMGTFLTALPPTPASAQETFFIPKDDGYGIGDCLATGAACASDAWSRVAHAARPRPQPASWPATLIATCSSDGASRLRVRR